MKQQMEPWTRSLLVRLTFASWRMVTALTSSQTLQAENQRLREINPKESIWLMKKADLVEVAIAELGYTRTQATAKTVIELRERLRVSRKEHREEEDPLLKVPAKMERMVVEELVSECTRRAISVAPLPGEKGARKTRAQMMIAIRDDVARRQTPKEAEDEWQMTVDSGAVIHEEKDIPPRSRPRGSR